MKAIVYYLITVLTVLFIPSKNYSQEKPVVETALISYTHSAPTVFGNDATAIYSSKIATVIGVKPHLFIEKRDIKTMEVLYSKELPDYYKFQEMARRSNAEVKCFLVKDKVYAFYQYIDNEKDTMYVLLQTINSTGEISQVYNVLKVPTRNPWTSSLIEFSPDKESFFVCANPKSGYVGNPNFIIDFNAKLFKTNNLEQIWDKDLGKLFDRNIYKSEEFKIDNKNNLYFVIKDKTTAILSILEPNSPTIKQLAELLSPSVKCENTSIKVNQNGDLVFVGVYADKAVDGKGFYGDPTFFLRVISTDNLSVKLSKDYQFDKDIMDKLSIGQITKKASSEQSNGETHSKNLFASPSIEEFDGGYYFSTEDIFLDNLTGKVKYKDVVFLKVLKEGDLKFMKLIPRYNEGWYSLKLQTFLIDKKMYFLFGENVELSNIKLEDYESATMPQMDNAYGNVIVVSTNDSGSLNKKTLFENKKKEAIFTNAFASRHWVFDNNKLIFVLENTKANTYKYVAYKID